MSLPRAGYWVPFLVGMVWLYMAAYMALVPPAPPVHPDASAVCLGMAAVHALWAAAWFWWTTLDAFVPRRRL